ncbi:MAG: putative zinc-binding metallopeptidase, partial [Candidatus Aureabacteria bacterium]|nr:putative zinc-binding metallopeptidase [Candidatus Auribacterota bacterium]
LEHYAELKRRKIRFRPRFYLGADIEDGWGCVNGTICIEIPFYLSSPGLMKLHAEYYADVEAREEIMKILRHETGHAINYAYKLHARRDWKSIFGDFSKRYPTKYPEKPWSKKHVQHLDLVYAQRHPDDDWAESFAVWLTPGLDWRKQYRGWDAIEKLIYVDIIMKGIAGRLPVVRKIAYDHPAKRERRTIAELYDVEAVTALSDGEMKDYIDDLSQIFMRRVRRRGYHLPATDFLRRFREAIVEGVARWIMHSNKNSVRKIIRRLESICRHYRLLMVKSEEGAKLAEVTALVTWYVVNDIHKLD